VTGNSLLERTEYLDFTRLLNVAETEDISLPIIKDRFEKHPYVEKAEVELLGTKEAKVLLTEKKIMAMILIEPESYFLSDEYQLLPMIVNTRFDNVPVISNSGLGRKDIRPLNFVKTENIIQAFKIIEAINIADQEIAASLSEINLRNGGDIILSFSDLNAPVVFGRNGTAEKIVYLETLWDKEIDGRDLVSNSEYIDLRFANEIFIGSSETTGLF